MRQTITLSLLGAALAAMMVGCGGTSGTALGQNTNPRIRVVDAFSSPNKVNITIENQPILTGVQFGATSDYNIFKNGNRDVQFLDGTSNGLLVDVDPLFQLNTFSTIVGYTDGTTNSAMVLSDVPTSSSRSTSEIRVVNAAPTTGPVDVYVTKLNTSITGVTPTAANVAVGDVNQVYTQELPDQYTVRITTPGTQTVLASQNVTVDQGQSVTLVAGASSGTTHLISLPAFSY